MVADWANDCKRISYLPFPSDHQRTYSELVHFLFRRRERK